METVQILDVKVRKSWLQELFKSIAEKDAEFVSHNKNSYINGRIDGLYDSLNDEEFALSIKEQAFEDCQVIIEKKKFLDEKFNSEIDYIVSNGYYLKDNDIANDEIVEHTEFTHSLFVKGLETKQEIKDGEVLEMVSYDNEKEVFYAQWYSEEKLNGYDKNGYQYLYFIIENKKVCVRCESEVSKSEVEGYAYQCFKCDEDLYTFEVKEVNSMNRALKMLNKKALEVYEYMKEKYINEGYFNSGFISMSELNKFLNYDAELLQLVLKELLENDIIIKRDCIADALELKKSDRQKLILKHKLNEVWEKTGSCFYPNKWQVGEVYKAFGYLL